MLTWFLALTLGWKVLVIVLLILAVILLGCLFGEEGAGLPIDIFFD